MVAYDLQALITRFDQAGEGEVVGALSGMIGEELLLDLLADALRGAGCTVRRLPGRPIRDDAAFKGLEDPKVRILDAWLVIDETTLMAVECKQVTSCSLRCGAVGEDVIGHAMAQWAWLETKHLRHGRWTGFNKVAMPVRPPAPTWSTPTAAVRRMLAIWTPISGNGRSVFSTATTTAPIDGSYQTIPIEVFSGSLYARALLAQGRGRVEATISAIAPKLGALDALFSRADVHQDSHE